MAVKIQLNIVLSNKSKVYCATFLVELKLQCESDKNPTTFEINSVFFKPSFTWHGKQFFIFHRVSFSPFSNLRL